MIPSLPSHVLRSILHRKALEKLCGVRRLSLCGKILRRTGQTCVLFDSFCGIALRTRESALQEDIDRSIKENYLVRAVCTVEVQRVPYLKVESISKASFQEEMYRTLESIEYWKKILLQKQPK
ncbi:hypothetical protein NECID01_1994 [Nematocida sp. AWRm77]|nr:hypothetical protein NECID01_1994 [Nematocida sp. AWRm77]